MANRTPFVSSLFNITLVLFFLGLFALLAFSFQIVVNRAIEQLELKLVLSDNCPPEAGRELAKRLVRDGYCNSAKYISKTEALKRFEHAGDDFMEAMDHANPLPAIIAARLSVENIRADSITTLSHRLMESTGYITEVYYPVKEVKFVQENGVRIQIATIILGLILVAIAYFLIMNTVKLAIYSKRLMIRTMELVGATNSFIRRPFMQLGLAQGFLGGLIASITIYAIILILDTQVIDLQLLLESPEMYVLFFCLILFGGGLGWFGSKTAVNRYLNQPIDKLA